MPINDDLVKKSKLQEFVLPSDGLDGELMAFINSLIDQNSELAGKLEHLDSLKELAEKTVIEARKEAEEIKVEAEREAKARADAIVARAIEKTRAAAQKVIARAKEKAEAEAQRIIAEARQKAEQSFQERLSLAEKQAQEIIKAAEEKGSLIIAEALNKAEAEALRIRKQAEQLRESSQKTDERQPVKNSREASGQLLMEPVVAPETTGISMAEKKPPEPVSEVCVSAPRAASAGKPAEPPSSGKVEGGKKDNLASYDDVVELAIIPPISLDQLLRLHKHLKKNSGVKVVELKGSLEKGVTIRILVQAQTPLLNMLAVLPEIDKVSDEPIEVGKISSAHRKGNSPTPRTISVTMKR